MSPIRTKASGIMGRYGDGRDKDKNKIKSNPIDKVPSVEEAMGEQEATMSGDKDKS